MNMSIHFSTTCLLFGSVLLMIANAALPDIKVRMHGYLNKSYMEAKRRLLAEAVVSEPQFHKFLEGKSVKEFQNETNAYNQFKNQLHLYYIGYIFFDKFPQFKHSMNRFAANWVIKYPKNNHSKESCIEDYMNFLLREVHSNKIALISIIQNFEKGHRQLKIALKRTLTSRIDLEFTKLTDPEDQTFYNELFTAFDNREFEKCFKKFISWRNRVHVLLGQIEHKVEELYESYQSLNYPYKK